jgi:asparagine synthase (glutamine-hydrolysing)
MLLQWDSRREELLIAADHCGLETAFYAVSDRFYGAAGNPLSLRFLSGIGAEPDLEHYVQWFMGHRFLHNRSMFRGIARVPPGHLVRIRGRNVQVEPFWTPGKQKPIRFRRDQDYVIAARELLDKVVQPHVQQRGEIAAELTAGLDSTGVVATAARLSPDCRIHTFTSVSPPGLPISTEPGCTVDDWPGASAVAAMYPNVIAHRIEAGGLTALEVDPTPAFEAFGFPQPETSADGWHHSRLQAVKALGPIPLLSGSGQGLSEYGFGAYADFACSGQWISLGRELRHKAAADGMPISKSLRQLVLAPLVPPNWRRHWSRLRGKHDSLLQQGVALNPSVIVRFDLEGVLRRSGKLGPIESVGTARDQMIDGLDRFIGKLFRQVWMYRREGIDLRLPLVDPRVIDFVLAIPPNQFLRNGQMRFLARRALSDRLPGSVVWDKRHYLVCPEWHDRMSPIRPAWLVELDRLEQLPVARDILDLPRLRELAGSWPTEPRPGQQVPYRQVLARGIVAGQFLRWMYEGFNRRSRSTGS